MNQGTAVAGGGGGSGDGDGTAGDGNDGEGAGGGSGGDDAGGDNRNAPDANKNPKCGYEGHPVDVVTGRAFTHDIVDLSLPGPLPFEFSRAYSSTAADRDVGLGHGWSHSFGWEIEVSRRRIRVWNEKGVSVDFPMVREGEQVVGPWGWVLRRDGWGFAVDHDEGVWLIFSARFEHGKRYRLTAIEDRNKNRISITYEDERLVQIVDSVGRTIRVQSDNLGRINSLAVKNAPSQGRWVDFARYEYNDAGDLVSVIDADGFVWRYAYDEFHRLTTDVDRAGLAFHFVYDRQNRCIETWGDYPGRRDPSLVDGLPKFLADGHTRVKGIHHCKFHYMSNGYTEVIKIQDAPRFTGNRNGTLSKAVKGGAVWTYDYDARGHMTASTDPLGFTKRYTLDERGRVVRFTDELGRTMSTDRNANGDPSRITDAAGNVWSTEHDGRGNTTLMVAPGGAATTYAYDERGLVTLTTLPNGATSTVRYDDQANPVEMKLPDGSIFKWTWDSLGRPLSETDPTGAQVRYAWSDRGDLVAIFHADGGITRAAYDGENRMIASTDPLGQTFKRAYGGFERIVEETDALGQAVLYRYDYEGQLRELHNPRGEIYRFFYDANHRPIRQETFDHRVYEFRYDLAGRLQWVQDRLGRRTKLTYDPVGNLVGRELNDGTVETFEYDILDRIVAATNADGEVRFERNALGQIVRESEKVGDEIAQVERTFDTMAEATELRTSLGYLERMDRDLRGRVTRRVLTGGFETRHQRDARGFEVFRNLPEGGRIETAFDARGRATHRRAVAPGSGPGVGPSEPQWVGARRSGVTKSRLWQYDAAGCLVGEDRDRDGMFRFEYDPVGRLASVLRDGKLVESNRYDGLACRERSGESRVYGPGGRLLRKDDTEYVWDDDGQLVEKRRKRDGGHEEQTRYTWTDKGQLRAVDLPDGRTVEYRYDAFWRRIERTMRARQPDGQRSLLEATRYVWDGDLLVHEIMRKARQDGDPIVSEKTFCFDDEGWFPVAHRDAVVRDGVRRESPWYFYMTGPTGMPFGLVRPDGTVASHIESDTWGGAKELPGADTTTPLRFLGQYADDDTGLSYNRFRYYDPDSGMYISADPVGVLGGLNSFSYVTDPLSWSDPLGLTDNTPIGDAVEDQRKKSLAGSGFSMLPTQNGSGNGIDILAIKKGGNGQISALRIEEDKGNGSRLATDTHNDQQMSDDWTQRKFAMAQAEQQKILDDPDACKGAKKLAKQKLKDLKNAEKFYNKNKNDPSKVQRVLVHGDVDKNLNVSNLQQQTITSSGSSNVKLGAPGPVKN
jgi:RHS repeat-associated protein